VVLGTATIAAFSMMTALSLITGEVSWWLAIPVLVWGLFVLNLDRWLVSSSSGVGLRSRASILAPRLILAFLFGIIIAEPLVLRIFDSAIEERVANDRQQDLVTYQSQLRACNPVPGTDTARSRATGVIATCSDKRLLVTATTPLSRQTELQNLRKRAQALEVTVNADAKRYAELNEKARRECNGTRGAGLTGIIGQGPNCQRLRAEADQYKTTHQIDQNVLRLKELNDQIGILEENVGTTTRSYEDALNQAIEAKVEERRRAQKTVGLLERFRALDDLASESFFLFLNRWLITFFFITVDCLPVIVKFFSGHTHYERMVEEKLSSAERVFVSATETTGRRETANSEVTRYQIDVTTQSRKEEIADKARVLAAQRTADLQAEIDSLTGRLLAQSDASKSHRRSATNGGTRIVDAEEVIDLRERRKQDADPPPGDPRIDGTPPSQ
jgi:hypothetical protein